MRALGWTAIVVSVCWAHAATGVIASSAATLAARARGRERQEAIMNARW